MSHSQNERSLPPAVVLCGGLGTRLRPAVDDRPKVLAPINDTPFLSFLLHQLYEQGVREVILSIGYLGDMVRDFAGDGSAWNLEVHYAEEPEPLGTGGALRFAAEQHDLNVPFLALNGDTFFDGALDRLVRMHQRHLAPRATLALTQVSDAARYGTVETSDDGTITAFREKDEGPRTETAWINAGAYVLAPTLLSDVPPGEVVSLERDIFPRHVGDGLCGCRFADATFLDIGTPEDYARAESVLVS